MTALRNLAGQKFGRLTVKCRVAGRRTRHVMWNCLCDCGQKIIVRGSAMTTGNSSSCGCYQRELMAGVGRTNGTHRLSHTPEYPIWTAMKHRCYVKKNPRYKYYGAMGVRVCDRWLHGDGARDGFECFLIDMGPRPPSRRRSTAGRRPDFSIDRFPDNDGDYEPSNCRWATAIEQRHNRRDFRPHLYGASR